MYKKIKFSLQNKQASLAHVLNLAHDNSYPIAYWKCPDSLPIRCIVQIQPQPFLLTRYQAMKQYQTGFIISPFAMSQDSPIQYIAADIIIEFSLIQPYWEVYFDQTLAPKLLKTAHQFIECCLQPMALNYTTFSFSSHQIDTSQAVYIALVNQAKIFIQAGQAQKIVTSMVSNVALPKFFHPIASFLYACTHAPYAMVYLISTNIYGTWLGASPEVLLSIDASQRCLYTMALAGTQQVSPKKKFVAWSKKELEEQAIVSHFIRDCLHQQHIQWIERGPYTSLAGYLAHLKTDFDVGIKSTKVLWEVALNLLKTLHPTPAVCGIPPIQAQYFIQQYEAHVRSLYSGFLGPLDQKNSSYFFVNIRCMQLFSYKALVYTGGGIIQSSEPSYEWDEVQAKYASVLQTFGLLDHSFLYK